MVASAQLSTVISTAAPTAAMSGGVPLQPAASYPGDCPLKTCSLCGNTKPLRDFGPKKGARDGKDCYCRVCSTLRRRYSIPVRHPRHRAIFAPPPPCPVPVLNRCNSTRHSTSLRSGGRQ